MHIVLLGARPEVVIELHDLGHTLTSLYTEINKANTEKYADRLAYSGFIPSYDVPELAWSVLLHLGVADEVDLVIPNHELAVVTAGFLNRLIGAESDRLDLPIAMAGRDKAYQKSLWTAHGVPTARYVTLTNTPRSLKELQEDVGDLRAPFVVKPPALGGSRLVTACATLDDVFETLRDNGELRHSVIEERQSGDEWHLDGSVVDGRVEHLMVSRYLAPLIETKHGSTLRSVAYPPKHHAELYGQALEFAQSAVDGLGGRWGVFHLEVFGEPGSFTAGELAWRPAGVLAPESAERTIGVNLWVAHARLLAGEELTVRAPEGDSVFGFVCLPVKPGAVNGVTREDLEELPGVRHIQMVVQPGRTMREMHASTVCVAMALIEGKDIADCERLINEAVQLTRDLHDAKSV
ncbi:hypothetical protein AB0N93_16095 [Streptomyces sp. NPDC091267]|uniref:ATP-grasp domain-containing protein n=1 Tax=unclassified Streptomyces TaxID=2593676 RepID=UPI003422DA2F